MSTGHLKIPLETMKRIFILFLIATFPMANFAQSETSYYFDQNVGIALVEDGFPFPGVSLLGGVRKTYPTTTTRNGVARTVIFESEIGLALPTGVTGKVGIGHLNEMTGNSTSVGVRIFPLHAYVQQAFGTRRCEREVSPRTKRRLERKGRDRSYLRCSDWYFTMEVGGGGEWSFDSVALFSVGHRMFFN